MIVRCETTFDISGPKLIDLDDLSKWLHNLPTSAQIKTQGMTSDDRQLVAFWSETR